MAIETQKTKADCNTAEEYDAFHGWDEKREDWWKKPSFIRQQRQLEFDGALQEVNARKLKLGAGVCYPFGVLPKGEKSHKVLYAVMIAIHGPHSFTLRVFSDGHPSEDFNITNPYYTSATPGTLIASGC